MVGQFHHALLETHFDLMCRPKLVTWLRKVFDRAVILDGVCANHGKPLSMV